MPPPLRRNCVEIRAILEAHVAGVALVDDEHVGLRPAPRGREVQSRRRRSAPRFVQDLAPVGEELRIVVLAFAVRLQARRR